MSTLSGRSAPLVRDAAGLVRDASTIDAALGGLAEILGRRLPLWRASVRAQVPGGDHVVIVSVWCAGETLLGPGTKMSALASSLPEVARDGGSVVFGGELDDLSLPDQILRDEGILSSVSIPLRAAGAVIGILSFSSRTAGTFQEADAGFFAGLGAALEERLVELIGRSGMLPA